MNNNQLILGSPKTRTSRNWVALSDRVAHTLRHRTIEQSLIEPRTPTPARTAAEAADFVFALPDGRPLHPRKVTVRFRQLCERAGVPRCSVHDLRHLAATIAISHGVPLTVVSKTLRHSTLSITANIYSHLTAQAAREAVDIIECRLALHESPEAPLPAATSARSLTNSGAHSAGTSSTPSSPLTHPARRRPRANHAEPGSDAPTLGWAAL